MYIEKQQKQHNPEIVVNMLLTQLQIKDRRSL